MEVYLLVEVVNVTFLKRLYSCFSQEEYTFYRMFFQRNLDCKINTNLVTICIRPSNLCNVLIEEKLNLFDLKFIYLPLSFLKTDSFLIYIKTSVQYNCFSPYVSVALTFVCLVNANTKLNQIGWSTKEPNYTTIRDFFKPIYSVLPACLNISLFDSNKIG